MTVAEIAKHIKREPAEIVKKLFMMGVMATQNQSLDGETIELLMVDYGIEAKQRLKWIMLTSNVSLSKMVISMKMNWLSVHQLLLSWDTLTTVKQPFGYSS